MEPEDEDSSDEDPPEFRYGPDNIPLASMKVPASCKLLGPIQIKPGKFEYIGSLPNGPPKVYHEGQHSMRRRFGPSTWYKYSEFQAKNIIWSWLMRAEAAGKV